MQPLRVGLIGADIQQSKTPALHVEEARAQGFDLRYDLIDLGQLGIGPDALPVLLAECEAAGFAGLNITHPCKQRILPLLDALSEDAGQLGAVNTVVLHKGSRTGHNTDWSGFMEGFRRGLPGAALGHILQIGAGGAGAAVAHALLKMDVAQLFLTDQDPGRAEALAADLNSRAGRDVAQAVTDTAAAMSKADGLVNATPMGMDAYPGLPLEADLLTKRHWVAEMVSFPHWKLLFLLPLAEKNCRVVNGGGMAVFQAASAFRLFTGREPDPERMLAHFTSISKQLKQDLGSEQTLE